MKKDRISYFGWRIPLALAFVFGGLMIVALPGWPALNWVAGSFLIAVGWARIGLVAHDAGHRQIFRRGSNNDILGHALANLLIGLPFSWWRVKHNIHHAHPNVMGVDPDIEFPLLAFNLEQKAARRGLLQRFVIRFQAQLLIFLLMLQAFNMRAAATSKALSGRTPEWYIELPMVAIHFAWFIPLLWFLAGPWGALVVWLTVHVFFGLCLSGVFAPNHKGMDLLYADTELNFAEKQILTSRNVRRNWFNDWWFGGLNLQVEHHLFPLVPRRRLGRIQPMVREYCVDRNLPYYETGVIRGYWEILRHLNTIGKAPLKTR